MELYNNTAREINKLITTRYSTSFGLSSTLFDKEIRDDIYAIYGLVRIADEIVDTYRGTDAGAQLNDLESDTYRALKVGYSANPVVHAFALTAQTYGIDIKAITSFFASMRMDLKAYTNTKSEYERYIHGSAEAVGLMCLSVFVNGDKAEYAKLAPGACALGAAYQKINFLRDLSADKHELDRWYFPDSSYETFNDDDKQTITNDIREDITLARDALAQLPRSSRRAVVLSLAYYDLLLRRLEQASISELKQRRMRVPNPIKLLMYMKARLS